MIYTKEFTITKRINKCDYPGCDFEFTENNQKSIRLLGHIWYCLICGKDVCRKHYRDNGDYMVHYDDHGYVGVRTYGIFCLSCFEYGQGYFLDNLEHFRYHDEDHTFYDFDQLIDLWKNEYQQNPKNNM